MNRIKSLFDKFIKNRNQDTRLSRFIKLVFKLIGQIISRIPFYSFLQPVFEYLWKDHRKVFVTSVITIFIAVSGLFAYLAAEYTYIYFDSDESRGAVALENSVFDNGYSTPLYLEQNWSARDSLYFYNTTIGSDLIPYDFFLALEQVDSTKLFRDNSHLDQYRFLSQKPTFSNPEGFPVGITKDSFEGADYVGLTCSACHTSQINFNGNAIRIDGGPALVDITGFVSNLIAALRQTLQQPDKFDRFANAVLERNNDFDTKAQVRESLAKSVRQLSLQEAFQFSTNDYGFGRLDFLGRGLNTITINSLTKENLISTLQTITYPDGRPLLTAKQIDLVTKGTGNIFISAMELASVFERLRSNQDGYPGITVHDEGQIRSHLIWNPDAPVNYPELWHASRDNYMYWSGAISNSLVDQTTHKVLSFMNAFGGIEWQVKESGFSLASLISGQSEKNHTLSMRSSIDKINVDRLNALLQTLEPPRWPQEFLGRIDPEKASRGKIIYSEYCQSCHERNTGRSDDLVNSYFVNIDIIGTDSRSAYASAVRTSASGNFEDTYQTTEVGEMLIGESIPSILLAKAVLPAVWASPDPDKTTIHRQIDRVKTFIDFYLAPNYSSVSTIRNGLYKPNDTANPVNALISYRAKPLNGIWATAPYLHNGSVPTLYDLLLPVKREGDPDDGEYRPASFTTGSREFDPVKVGFNIEGFDGFHYETSRIGNFNVGHEFGSGRSARYGVISPPLTAEQRWDLVEFLKTL